MPNKDQTNNPYDLCIFRSNSDCQECLLKNKLDCQYDLNKLLRFVSVFFFIVISGSVGLVHNNLMEEFYSFLIILGLFSLIFFEVWEIKILCSHCPFYAENQKTLHCCANYSSLKLWKYNPGPMSTTEKVQLIIGFVILTVIVLLPSIVLIIHQYYLWAIPPIIGLAGFGYVIKKFHCQKCLNFSCPFNAIPQDIVDEFIKRNPVMKEAWEKRAE